MAEAELPAAGSPRATSAVAAAATGARRETESAFVRTVPVGVAAPTATGAPTDAGPTIVEPIAPAVWVGMSKRAQKRYMKKLRDGR